MICHFALRVSIPRDGASGCAAHAGWPKGWRPPLSPLGARRPAGSGVFRSRTHRRSVQTENCVARSQSLPTSEGLPARNDALRGRTPTNACEARLLDREEAPPARVKPVLERRLESPTTPGRAKLSTSSEGKYLGRKSLPGRSSELAHNTTPPNQPRANDPPACTVHSPTKTRSQIPPHTCVWVVPAGPELVPGGRPQRACLAIPAVPSWTSSQEAGWCCSTTGLKPRGHEGLEERSNEPMGRAAGGQMCTWPQCSRREK
mmetsp:Transcript_28802/g.75893  ORF Transcript_28802/g.75893 Transcript_28802/m.75893 type:complete len:260 (+) Transcript_28802:116-895(+)